MTLKPGILGFRSLINNNYIHSDGSTPVSGSINMDGNTLYNVPDPVNPGDVATKEYADSLKTTYRNIVAVPIRFCGNSIKNKYHFTFGGNVYYTLGLGFLVPHSGRIKKIQQKLTGFTEHEIGSRILLSYIFTLTIIRDTEEVTNLARYRCLVSEHRHNGYCLEECGTDLDLKNIPFPVL